MNEGSFAQLSCIVSEGDEPLDISWSFHSKNITADTGTSITKIGSRGTVLVIPRVSHVHTGMYECRADNPAGSTTQSVLLNVNGMSKNHSHMIYVSHNFEMMSTPSVQFCYKIKVMVRHIMEH